MLTTDRPIEPQLKRYAGRDRNSVRRRNPAMRGRSVEVSL